MKYLLIFLTAFFTAQSLRPTLGGAYIAGLDYDQDHDYFIGQAGLIYEPLNAPFFTDEIRIEGEYHYDYLEVYDPKQNNFFAIRLHNTKYFNDWWGLTYNVGYFDSVHLDFKNKFTYGFGIQVKDDEKMAFLRYEQVNNYPHIVFGVTVKMWELLKRKR